MKKIFLLSFVFTLALSSCKKEMATITSEKFNELLSNYNIESYDLYPLNATFKGIEGYNDKLPNNLTNEFTSQQKVFYTKYINQLTNINDADLSETEKLSKAVLSWDCEVNLEKLTFKNYTPVDQMWTRNLIIGQLAIGSGAQPFKTAEDYKNWLKRIDFYIEWINSAEDNMREGIKIGHVLPKSLIKKVIPQFESLAIGEITDHLFFTPAKNIPKTISPTDHKNIIDSYTEMITKKIIPANKKMADFLKNEYLPAGRESSGISETPNGKAYYKYQIKTYTTTTMTADEIHQLGLNEVARILSEMEKIKMKVGFKGDLKTFFNHVRNRKELMPFKTAEEVVANFNKIHEIMKPQVEKIFGKKPKTLFEVRRTESFREASASAEYNSGSLDGTRPGVFYIPVPNASKYNVFSDEALFLHEAIPGHHYQTSLTQENESLPEFRKTLWYSAYGEGWALYTESLGKELGLYTDPYQYFGMLGMEMHRAIRLVVDTGIHTKGWSREKAIQYSLDNEAESEASITREIERYMANPGQALSYKIGQLKIRELREKATAELGNKFDIKEFHNQILETGCIPLQLLENKINTWIEVSK